MSITVHAQSSLQRRAIRVGLLTHDISASKSTNITIVTNRDALDVFPLKSQREKNYKVVFVCLDAIPLGLAKGEFEAGDLSQKVDEIMYVGSLYRTSSQFGDYMGVPCKMLFNQDSAIKTVRKIRSANILYRSRLGYHPSSLYLAKDLAHNSIDSCFPSPKNTCNLIFAGQDGSHTFRSLFDPRLVGIEIADKALHALSNLKFQSCYSIECVSKKFHEAFDITRDLFAASPLANREKWIAQHLQFILFQSLKRLLLLSFLAQQDRLIFYGYPHKYVNVYMRKYFSRFLLLDFGGAGGVERFYPRSVDAMIAGHTLLTPNHELERDGFLHYDNNKYLADKSLFEFYQKIDSSLGV